MTVILIHNGVCGILGIANNYHNAVDYLIKEEFIEDTTEVWNDAAADWDTVINLQGKDWESRMRNEWDIENFNYFFFNSTLSLEEFDLIGTDKEGTSNEKVV